MPAVQCTFLHTSEPNSVSTGRETTTTSIAVTVAPAVTTSEVIYYKIRGHDLKCDARAGPAIPSCKLSGLVPGKWYNVSAAACGEDQHCSRKTRGRVNTLPEGETFRFELGLIYKTAYTYDHF